LEVTQIRPGLVGGADALRSRMSYTPPVAGGAAAVTAACPVTGPVSEPVRRLAVRPTTEAVPVTRKSPAFHFAVVIVIRSVTAVGVNGADFADAAP
jgi:hypothetical protein